MKNQLLLHCGGKPASLDELQAVPLPEETDTYKPVGHYELVLSISDVANSLLRGCPFRKGMYALSSNGKRLFALHVYDTKTPDMGISIGFRNSYDRSLSIGIAVGASVMVCDNLALTGEVAILRKHTTKVLDDLETAIVKVVYKAEAKFSHIVKSTRQMKETPISSDDAYGYIGRLFGHGILTPRQLPVAKREWETPSYEAFAPRTLWSFYNAATAALKSTPPQKIMERHIQLHNRLAETLPTE